MIPFLCPELPDEQKEALHYLVKVPLVYGTVGIRSWKAFQKLGIQNVRAPGSYWESISLNAAINIGDYHSPKSPDEPILLHLSRTPCKPGLPAREQHKAGRMELLVTSFEDFERRTRDQLARILSAGGFAPAEDIQAITINRWPHGYGYEYNPLFDPDWPEAERPQGSASSNGISAQSKDARARTLHVRAVEHSLHQPAALYLVEGASGGFRNH